MPQSQIYTTPLLPQALRSVTGSCYSALRPHIRSRVGELHLLPNTGVTMYIQKIVLILLYTTSPICIDYRNQLVDSPGCFNVQII